MRVFILEDDLTRVQFLRELLMDHDLTIVDSCKDVGRFNPPYDLILLDHDLGGRQMTEHEDDGYAFIKLIKDHINPKAEIIYHSYNPGGAARMWAELDGRGYVAPFRSGAFNRILTQVLAREE